ncbi:hypothetical protein BX283_0095 [Streptomyces sp. TLI_146]|nr:hypothetical protein BX283_0095 [Streptomyces sp. TLI_146]
MRLERRMEINYPLRSQAQGHLNPPEQWMGDAAEGGSR